MKQSEKPELYCPEILKSKIKDELNDVIEKEIKNDPQMKLSYRRMTKKEKHKLLKVLREEKLGGRTIYGALLEV